MKNFTVGIATAVLALLGTSDSLAGQRSITRLLPAGLAFAPMYRAAGVNASSLVSQKGTLVEAGYGPRGESWNPDRFEAAFASANKNLGLGLEYVGNRYDSATWNHGVNAGVGANLDPVQLGLGLRDGNVSGSFDPAVDLSLAFSPGGTKGVTAGGVLYNVNGSPYLGAFLGFIKERNYFLEANLVTPSFSNMGANGYQLGVAAGVNVGIVGVSFHTRYFTDSRGFAHTLGAAIWATDWLNLGVQFDTPRTFTFRTAVTF